MIIFDFDQTLVDTSPVESLRASGNWKGVMAQAERLRVYPGIDKLLADLSATGHQLAIVTKSPDMVPKWFVRRYGWPIDVIVGYHDVRRRKPYPDGLLLALEKGRSRAQESFHVGDQADDTAAARAAGVVAIGVTWGISNDTDLLSSKPDFVFDTVAGLDAYFSEDR